jgi:hypothetical protein
VAGMVEEALEQKLKRHEDALSLCMAEITRLREENTTLRAEGTAHTALRSVYNDPQASLIRFGLPALPLAMSSRK